MHMTSQQPYWCPKTMKWRPCWCPKLNLWELISFLIQMISPKYVFCCRKTKTFLLKYSKVARPLIESRITALVIPPELQTSKKVKTAVLCCHFNFITF